MSRRENSNCMRPRICAAASSSCSRRAQSSPTSAGGIVELDRKYGGVGLQYSQRIGTRAGDVRLARVTYVADPAHLVGVRFSGKTGFSKIASYLLLTMWEHAELENFDTEEPEGTIVGQFGPPAEPDHVAFVLELGNPLVDCVNQALAELTVGPGEDWLERPSNWVDGIRMRSDGVHPTPQAVEWLTPWLTDALR